MSANGGARRAELSWTGFWRVGEWLACGPTNGTRPRALVVDGSRPERASIANCLGSGGFQVEEARSAKEALVILAEGTTEALVAEADIPRVTGGDSCEDAGVELAESARELERPPVCVVLSAHPRPSSWIASLRAGCEAFLPRPLDPGLVLAELCRALQRPGRGQDAMGFGEVTELLADLVADAIEHVDPYTAGHGRRARGYADALARELGLPLTVRRRLELAAVAHDYGKIFLPDRGFLTKAGPLSTSEFEAVKQHPVVGARRLARHGCLRDTCRWIAEHHERWDGDGYPRGLRGEEISLPGRILCLVEVFDALVTRRPYKQPWSLERTRLHMQRQAGRAFDPELVEAFQAVLDVHGEEWSSQPQVDSALSS